jgi:hypothetical protein
MAFWESLAKPAAAPYTTAPAKNAPDSFSNAIGENRAGKNRNRCGEAVGDRY